ncbi:hypothetical protein JCM30760_15740 [Thiomicrorhabdus hydrogeniphila]
MVENIITTGVDKAYVLVVDDEPLNRLIVEDLIEDRYELKLVDSGQACLQEIKKKKPHLILLDVNMPGLSGFEVCAILKKDAATRDIPIIFLTAMIGSDDEKRGFQIGAVDYITKPFTESILLARMQTHLSLYFTRQLLEKSSQVLQQERDYIEHIITSMEHDQRFEKQGIRQVTSPVEKCSGDIVLSCLSSNNHQHIFVGDFTGHGLVAAIAGPLVSSLFYTHVKQNRCSSDVLQIINDELVHKLPPQNFLAATYIDWNRNNQEVTIWNFGMPCSLYVRSNKIKKNSSISVALGIIPMAQHRLTPKQINFCEGDKLFIYTDGLAEVKNNVGEEFGETRTIEVLLKVIEENLELNDVVQYLHQFSGGKGLSDDTTLLEISA